MPIDDELTHRPHSTARTAGVLSSSRHGHSSRPSEAGPSARPGSASRRTGDASIQPPSQLPSTYQMNAPNAAKGTRLQLDGTRLQLDGTRLQLDGTRLQLDGTRFQRDGTRLQLDEVEEEESQEPTVVKSPHPSSLRRNEESTKIKQAPSMHQPSRRTQQGLSRLDRITSKMQEKFHHPPSQRYQEPSIVKQPIPSKHQPSHHPSSKQLQEPTIVKQPLPSMRKEPSQFKSMAPATAKSILTSLEDIKMASRQIRIETLPSQDRKDQEKWAQDMIKRAGVCPEKYAWVRRPGGYQCEGGGHGITDELLAEGKGGIMAHRTRQWDISEGPYYQDPNSPGRFLKHDGQGYFRGAIPEPK